MTKTEIIEHMAEKANLSKADAEKAANALLDTITTALANKEKVTLTGFGTFETKFSEGRTGRNPRTGTAVEIPAMHKPKFRPGKSLKEAVK